MSSTKKRPSYIVSLAFLWDEEGDNKLFRITPSVGSSKDDVMRILQDTHEKLCNIADSKDEYDYYGQEGRNADTLLWYISKKYGWKYEPESVLVDINMEFK